MLGVKARKVKGRQQGQLFFFSCSKEETRPHCHTFQRFYGESFISSCQCVPSELQPSMTPAIVINIRGLTDGRKGCDGGRRTYEEVSWKILVSDAKSSLISLHILVKPKTD